MRVEVVQSFPWSPDGFTVDQIELGVQDLADSCATVALAEGWARPVAAPAAAPAPPTVVPTPAPRRRR